MGKKWVNFHAKNRSVRVEENQHEDDIRNLNPADVEVHVDNNEHWLSQYLLTFDMMPNVA